MRLSPVLSLPLGLLLPVGMTSPAMAQGTAGSIVAPAQSTASPASGGSATTRTVKPPPCAAYNVCSSRPDERVSVSGSVGGSIGRPAVDGRSVFVSQVGDGNRARIVQASPAAATAAVIQLGRDNDTRIVQSGSAVSFAGVNQSGDRNLAVVAQDGGVLHAAQTGNGNTMTVAQRGSGGEQAAALAQVGSNNVLTLNQNGSGNEATLAQRGDGNAMSVAQSGAGNRLAWTQQGNGLSDLHVSQYGGQALQITQSR